MHSNFNYIRSIVVLVIVAGIFSLYTSCEKNVEIEIEEIEHMIVLNSTLKPDSLIEVSLSRTRHILDVSDLSLLSGGTVTVTDSLGTSVSLVRDSDGIYRTASLLPARGMSYTINAAVDGYEDVEASCSVPFGIDISELDTSSHLSEYGNLTYDLELVFDDPAGVNNYYSISSKAKVFYEDIYLDTHWDTLYVDLVKDTVIMGYVVDTIRTKYSYFVDLYMQSEDVVVESNVGGDVGILFSDKLFDGKTYTFRASVDPYGYLYSADTATVYISLNSIDENYYRYLVSKEKHYYTQSDMFATRVIVYSNIEGGVGIFGAYSSATDSIKFAPEIYRDYWEYYK